jgi:hypothetical protein
MKTMLRIAAVLLLASPLVLLAGDKPAPAYPLTVHVVSANVVVIPDGTLGGAEEYLHVLVRGKKYILATTFWPKDGILLPGDYKARLVQNKQPRAYSLTQTYEFLFSDGKTMKFALNGIHE